MDAPFRMIIGRKKELIQVEPLQVYLEMSLERTRYPGCGRCAVILGIYHIRLA